ncbi:elongation of very long chain fatty acids protein F-like [Drosophila sulfurigaster albostrigata]|uniref:elongation of very long chain fatty acids protein F-like n=1 Tax=Drosophila sulfurigaster albostrigata TaxID=89887 RepID=UPI002D21B440|nr:elongation of very long chain fatty acids protein F-like [Drosophila sulfurigaster albostrigata]
MNSTEDWFFQLPPTDPKTRHLPLLGSHWPITTIIAVYLIFVLKLGPKFMENRKPYNLKYVLSAYNIFQVIYNSILFGCSIYYLFISPRYNIRCMTSLPFDHPDKNIERGLCYAYFINKIIDLLDTVFFVLRKSYKQITLLHVYHHVLMTYPLYWGMQFYGSGGQYTTMGFLNTGVHAVMYFYYFISARYPELKGSIWWKKYITKLQLLQFILLLIQPIYVLCYSPGCKVPFFLHILQLVVSTSMIALFGKFYYLAYVRAKPQKSLKQE